jgi:hypothetical protein
VWTDWAVWRWSRSVLLTLAAVLTTASLRVFSLHDELLPGEVFWVGAMVVLVLGLAWLPRPVWWTSAFAATFVAFEVVTPADHYGPAWLVAYAVCVDLNSRRPVWLGVAFVGLLAAPSRAVASRSPRFTGSRCDTWSTRLLTRASPRGSGSMESRVSQAGKRGQR